MTNPGTGTAKSVTIKDVLPDGLKTSEGKSSIMIDAGDLAAGQSRNFTVSARATRIGRFSNTASASSADAVTVESNTTVTEVVRPVLNITNTVQSTQLLGRPVKFDITVVNSGNGASDNTSLNVVLPHNGRFLKTTAGTVSEGLLTWPIGTLDPKGSRSVAITMHPSGMGTMAATAKVTGDCADAADAASSTRILGIPAILLEVVDVNDPVEVGGDETYIITATNQGTSNGTNVRIAVTLEDTMKFLSATGDSAGTHQAGKVVFAPYPSLAPKARASWKVVVKALREGDIRFGVSMTSDQFQRPVAETEATNFYK